VPLQSLNAAEDFSTSGAAERPKQSHSIILRPFQRCFGGCGVRKTKMKAHVSFEGEGLSEGLVTDETGEGTHTGVCDHVIGQVMRHGERPGADLAVVRPVTTMKTTMTLQVI